MEIKAHYMTSEAVAEIPQCFPKLKRLILDFRTDCMESLEPISRLKNLKYLKIRIKPDISEQTVIDIIERCLPLRFVSVLNCKKLTSLTIKSMIEKAEKNSDINFVLNLSNEFKAKNLSIPKNLEIY